MKVTVNTPPPAPPPPRTVTIEVSAEQATILASMAVHCKWDSSTPGGKFACELACELYESLLDVLPLLQRETLKYFNNAKNLEPLEVK